MQSKEAIAQAKSQRYGVTDWNPFNNYGYVGYRIHFKHDINRRQILQAHGVALGGRLYRAG